ncbi:MAG: hypothetical protein LUH10_12255 [Tannerellaceae bacterium]|nr:hypothetical protein [Tannerellaceae bacterium]
MKKGMKHLTFCIPLRIDSPDRLKNISAVLSFLSRNFDSNYFILEADTVRRIGEEICTYKNLTYLFVEDHDPVFHRTRYINEILKQATTPYVAIWDADIVTYPDQIYKAYLSLYNSETVLTYPYLYSVLYLEKYYTDIFYRTLDIGLIDRINKSKYNQSTYYTVGGAFLVNRKKYLSVGGENEKFYGWAPEDFERWKRLEILGQKIEFIEGELFHLHHYRGINSYYINEEKQYQNLKELCRLCSLTTDELWKEILPK